MINLYQIFDLSYQLFSWAWTWKLPIANFTIYPIQLGLGILLMQCVEGILFPLDEEDDDSDDFE